MPRTRLRYAIEKFDEGGGRREYLGVARCNEANLLMPVSRPEKSKGF